MKRTISLVAAPSDIGAGTIGARMGPDALRVAGIRSALANFGHTVIDHGNLNGPANPWRIAVNGFRHLAEVTAWNQAVYSAIGRELHAGCLPILLGGDHCLSIGSISAVANFCRLRGKNLRVLWFDAHADCNTSELTPSGNIHGMPIACLCGHGPPELTALGAQRPALSPSDIRQIGIRSVDAGEKRLVHDLGIEVFDMRYIDEMGVHKTIQNALLGADANTHVHLSLDADFLDPDIAPGVGTPVRGGPSYREAHLCMELIADTGLLASLDVMEINPARDVRNQTAELAVDLLESLFGKSTLMRQ